MMLLNILIFLGNAYFAQASFYAGDYKNAAIHLVLGSLIGTFILDHVNKKIAQAKKDFKDLI